MANPAAQMTKLFSQPNGPAIELNIWGDEFANGWETVNGYTVVYSKSRGRWEYAELGEAGELLPSQIPATVANPPGPPHLRPGPEFIAAAHEEYGPTHQSVSNWPNYAWPGPDDGSTTGNGGSNGPSLSPPAWGGGGVNKLFIMVQFPDAACSFDSDDFEAHFFGSSPLLTTGPGNLFDYYEEISYGNLLLSSGPSGIMPPTSDPATPCYTMQYNKDDYDDGTNGQDDSTLVAEAIAAADASGVNWEAYDNDSDGVVDNVAIIYAGNGPDNGGYDGADPDVNNLWPHASSIGAVGVTDSISGAGLTISSYYMAPELLNSAPTIRTIGVFAHEYGHKLGLPDMYDTGGAEDSEGVGYWSLMGTGSWSSNIPMVENGEAPTHMNPYSKWYLDFLTPQDKTGLVEGVNLSQAATSPDAILLGQNNGIADDDGAGPDEYFLVENRQNTGFDIGIPGCGIVIWHVDENTNNNQTESETAGDHRFIIVEQADGQQDLQAISGGNRGDPGDPYPGTSGNYYFNDSSDPDARYYDGTNSNIQLEISSGDCAPSMQVNLGPPSADLSISKSDSPDPVIAGENLEYTISIHNDGPSSASNVTVIDTLPSGVAYVSDTDSCVENTPGTLTCDLDVVFDGQTRNFSIVSKVDFDYVAGTGGAGSLNNQAYVYASESDPVQTDNTAEEDTVVTELADVWVTKLCKPDTGPVVAGAGTGSCEIAVGNSGPSTARDVTLVDDIVANPGGSYTIENVSDDSVSASCTPSGGDVSCTIGDLDPNEVVHVTVEVSSNQEIDVNDVATASSPTPDPDLSNNSAEGRLSFVAGADISLVKLATPATATPGEPLTYDLTVTNNGPSTATNVVVSDVVPTGLAITSVSGTGGATCVVGVPGDASLPSSCNFGPIPASGSETMTIMTDVLPNVTWTLNNNAVASSDTIDPDNSNNNAGISVPVTPVADLVVAKTSSPSGPIAAGDYLTYDILVTNNGPSDATDVTLFDDLPAEVNYLSYFVNGGGACDDSQVGELSCSWNLIPAGASYTVNIEVQIKMDYAGGEITNYAEVNSDEDPAVPDDSDTDIRGVDVLADIWVEKGVNFPTGNPSGTIIFYLTAHNDFGCAAEDGSQCGTGGPSDATNVTIVDTLPSTPKKLVFEFADNGCTYDSGSHEVTCEFGTVPVGSFTTKEIQVRAKGNLGLLTNTAEISSDVPDPDPSNNVHNVDFLVQGGTGDTGGPGGGRGRSGGPAATN